MCFIKSHFHGGLGKNQTKIQIVQTDIVSK